MMMKPVLHLFLALSFSFSLVAAEAELPVCLTSVSRSDEASCVENAALEEDNTCSLYFQEYWILAGIDFDRNSIIGFENDIIVPFRIHQTRAFQRFNRHYYFTQVPNQPYHYLYAPSIIWPLECHVSLHNVRIPKLDDLVANFTRTSLFPSLQAKRKIKKGDPVLLECHNYQFATPDLIEDAPKFRDTNPQMICLDQIRIKDGVAFSKRNFRKNEEIVFGPGLHMHRTELTNPETQEIEELLNYCLGSTKSDIVFLPLIPSVHAIQAARDAEQVNVQVQLKMTEDEIQDLFFNEDIGSIGTDIFGDGEHPKIPLTYVATRDIKVGEPLYMDRGVAWDQAWEKYQKSVNISQTQFRHEIGFDHALPPAWLDYEAKLSIKNLKLALVTDKLEVGEVREIRLNTGELISENIFRVGLPGGFADKMEAWARDWGLIEVLEHYILNGKSLAKGGEERFLVNGAQWWTRRFDGYWHSDMHYITPNDDISNQHFMNALAEAGFDKVVSGIGHSLGLEKLTCFYASLIAVSHCTRSYMHSDSNYKEVFNLIFPLSQVNETLPELTIGADDEAGPWVPYRYERDNAVLLGLDGQHGTAPCDYRGRNEMRVVMSIYMGDFTNADVLNTYVDEWEDPPYPGVKDANLRAALSQRVHWSKTDPSAKVGRTMPLSIHRATPKIK